MKQKSAYFSGRSTLAAAVLALSLCGCGEARFKINGDIAGADNKSIVLEKSDFHGRWIPIDSARTSSSGSFSISRPAPAAPEIFRLELEGKYIYLPIDSAETVNVESSLASFGTEFSLSGTPKAEMLERFEKDVMALPDNISPDSLSAFKKSVYSKYMRDGQGSIVSYYILTKLVGGKALFNPGNDDDLKYFAAVATGFKELRPNDPHTALLEKTSIDGIRRKNANNGKRLEIQAEELRVIDIDLPDENGKNRKLSELVGNGKPPVVIFSLLTHPDSPALNLELSKLYSRLGGNVNFYQVSLDPDQYAWREAAKNLPWVTVFDPDGQYSKAAQSYNVYDIPTYFIYTAGGDLSDRAQTIDELRKKL